MTGIPAEISQLTKLRILNYANNQITGLPNELGKLKNLEVFDLSGNNPSIQDLDGIKADLPSTTQIIL
jgi:Leucine-rich repeat (LRR) protein